MTPALSAEAVRSSCWEGTGEMAPGPQRREAATEMG